MAPVIAFACQALLASLSQWRDEPRVRPTAGSRASGVEARSARRLGIYGPSAPKCPRSPLSDASLGAVLLQYDKSLMPL
jgi:hypothetical protein